MKGFKFQVMLWKFICGNKNLPVNIFSVFVINHFIVFSLAQLPEQGSNFINILIFCILVTERKLFQFAELSF
jgi:hypothetical protein